MTTLSKSALHSPPELLKLYQDLVETSHDIIWQVDDHGSFTYLNPAAESIFGYRIEEMLGRPFTDFQAPDDARATLERFALLLQEDILKGFETAFYSKTGSAIYVVINSVSIRNEQGDAVGARGTAHDITQRKLAEEALRESEQRLKFHFENSPLAVIEWNADFIVTEWSAEAERIFGWKKEETIGCSIDRLNIIHKDDIPIVAQTMKKLTSGIDGPVVSCNRNHTKAGAVLECIWYNTVLFDGKRRMSSVMSLVEDVTEQRKAERNLRSLFEQTQRDAVAKTELLNEVNHRVKNNLMMILGLILAEKRNAEGGEPEGRASIWNRFESRIDALLSVHQMLSDSQWKPVVLSDLAERICTGVLSSESAIGQDVDFQVDHSDIVVSARQAGHLALVFNELMMNSLKHAFRETASPAIRVTSRLEGDRIRIEFRDNGCGYSHATTSGHHHGVWQRLIRQIIEETLDGALDMRNERGASAIIHLGVDVTAGRLTAPGAHGVLLFAQ